MRRVSSFFWYFYLLYFHLFLGVDHHEQNLLTLPLVYIILSLNKTVRYMPGDSQQTVKFVDCLLQNLLCVWEGKGSYNIELFPNIPQYFIECIICFRYLVIVSWNIWSKQTFMNIYIHPSSTSPS